MDTAREQEEERAEEQAMAAQAQAEAMVEEEEEWVEEVLDLAASANVQPAVIQCLMSLEFHAASLLVQNAELG